MRLLFFIIIVLQFQVGISQISKPSNGAVDNTHTTYAFTYCTLHVSTDEVLNQATLIIKDGKVLKAGTNLEAPKEAIVVNLDGKHIYPAFIDLYSDYGIPPVKKENMGDNPKTGAYAWNQAIKSDVEAKSVFTHQEKQADELRKQGIGAVLTSSKDGIVRGSGVLVNLSNQKENESMIKDRAAGFYSFNKGSSSQLYPTSLMGSMALLRQTYYDAKWYAESKNPNKETNLSLNAFNILQELPSIIEVSNKYNAIKAKQIGDEFKVKYIIKGAGDEYQRLYDIQNTYARFIIPVNFPEAMDVEDPFDAEQVSLTELKHWEMAPANLSTLEKNYVQFCITSADLKDKSQFLNNIRKAVKYGLSEKTALKALTFNPALFIGVQDKIGSLKAGMYANFFICNKFVFEDDAIIYETWSNGIKHSYSDLNSPIISGNYQLNLGKEQFRVNILPEQQKYKALITVSDSIKLKGNLTIKNNLLTLSFLRDSINSVRLSGNYTESSKSFSGKGQNSEGEWVEFSLTFISNDSLKSKPNKVNKIDIGKVYYPFTAYGESLPETEGLIKDLWGKFKKRYDAVLIKDATVWTNEPDSILKEYDVYIVDGKIVRIAPNIDAPKTAFAKVINAKGLHLTPGIIDEHSHIALYGVNEWANASSAEARMGDVVNPEDINIYRQLAGGVTTAQLLHGSANPIGGQSVLIKLRWGKGADELKYEKAPAFIKFALGENVKHSNGLSPDTKRFPQTRMGVEQVYYDYFTRAKAYKQQIEAFAKLSPKQIVKENLTAPKRDLGLDALVEILDGKRDITCHSYVQSELNMLLHVADSMRFKVNTFTHVLEGYKVADKIKTHETNASTFADWWAYKLEVMDAIPYNAAMLTKAGVNTAINSDDAEMGRRLNQEAAKTIKYGGLTEIQALKLVTINPAKMLHIDDKVGSIKVGKSGDVVLWTDNPMSIYAKVQTTIIDGQIYYDKDEDLKLQADIQKERARIIAKLILEKQKGAKVTKPQAKKQPRFHCDSEE